MTILVIIWLVVMIFDDIGFIMIVMLFDNGNDDDGADGELRRRRWSDIDND